MMLFAEGQSSRATPARISFFDIKVLRGALPIADQPHGAGADRLMWEVRFSFADQGQDAGTGALSVAR